jgi:hypothetical protein
MKKRASMICMAVAVVFIATGCTEKNEGDQSKDRVPEESNPVQAKSPESNQASVPEHKVESGSPSAICAQKGKLFEQHYADNISPFMSILPKDIAEKMAKKWSDIQAGFVSDCLDENTSYSLDCIEEASDYVELAFCIYCGDKKNEQFMKDKLEKKDRVVTSPSICRCMVNSAYLRPLLRAPPEGIVVSDEGLSKFAEGFYALALEEANCRMGILSEESPLGKRDNVLRKECEEGVSLGQALSDSAEVTPDCSMACGHHARLTLTGALSDDYLEEGIEKQTESCMKMCDRFWSTDKRKCIYSVAKKEDLNACSTVR